MRKETLYEMLGDVNEKRVEEALTPPRKKTVWVRWAAAAACLCLVIGGITFWQGRRSFHQPAGGGDAGGVPSGDGYWAEGVDPVIASIAQYPAGVDIHDVADAAATALEEDELGALGAYLPTQLPEGYHFQRARLYETTMTDGTVYTMLRVTYYTDDEDQMTPAPDGTMEYAERLIVMVYDFQPQVDRTVHPTREATLEYLANITPAADNLMITFQDGEAYLNIIAWEMILGQLQDLIRSIP